MPHPESRTRNRCRRGCLAAVAIAVVALASILTALWHLTAATRGLEITHLRAGPVPITLYRPASTAPAPVVVVAHGFAGSQQLMQPYAITLARNGYIVATFDFAGHGRNAAPFVASLMDQERRLRVLLDGLEPTVALALAQPGADGRLALVGHSMAADVLARYAQAHLGQVSALVLLSPYLSKETRTDNLRNLLLIYGGLEPEMLHRQGIEVLAGAGGEAPQAGPIYGSLADGSARRLLLAEGVEHIGVLYAAEGLAATLDWLNQTFGRSGSGFIDKPGPWLGLLYLGLVALAWPLSRLLPEVAARPLGAGLGWRRLLPAALLPAVLTPLILWKLPTDFLPVLIGDYLALHFAVYGLLTWLALWLMRGRGGQPNPVSAGIHWRRLALGAAATAIYFTLVFGLATDHFVTALLPGPERTWVVLAMLAGTLSYFTADEWLTRGEGAARGAYAFTKLLFLLSLLLAVGLNLNELFFLIIIVPAILVLFFVYGVMSGWVYRRAKHPWVSAIALAVAFATATAVTFPLVGGA
ncbi:alpha/beta hydrolase [Thiocystis violacea]|nr:alpha/beta fold hydrolase [Thiocystis violacea]MBK1720842.1 alpha/beta hydrolase [Thiocystis violacea]